MDLDFKPGFGEMRPKLDIDAPPGFGPPRDRLLSDAHQIAQRNQQETERRYFAVVEGYVTGETSPDEIHHACEAAGKTLQDFEADAKLLRERHRLLELLASEPAARQRQAELQQSLADASDRRQKAAAALNEAENRYVQAQALEGDAAEELDRFKREDLTNINIARHRLQTDPEMLKFASPDVQRRAAQIKAAEEEFERLRTSQIAGETVEQAEQRVHMSSDRINRLEHSQQLAQQQQSPEAGQIMAQLEHERMNLASAQRSIVDAEARRATWIKQLEDAQQRVQELKRA